MFVFTSCTNNYIPKARVLASTLKAFHPDWRVCLLLGETPPEGFALEDEPFDRLALFDELGIPAYPSWLFRHRVVEICTAAKGPALYHFLATEGHGRVMYLDPDIMVCNTLDPLERLLDTHDVLLTPHQLAPQETEQGVVDNELCALRHGVFNLGFVAAARRGDGLRFAAWWRDRLLRYCYDDVPNGLFTDQRWCDFAPAFFPKLHVVRDPGCNAASWNLTDRTISRGADGVFLANDGPLRFYHFTGIDSGSGDNMTARYAKNMPAVRELWALYRQRLAASGQSALGRKAWAHSAFADGTPVSDAMRLLYRQREDVQKAFPDPFARPGFFEWYQAEQAPDSTPCGRARRKVGTIARKARHVLEQHGGFPRGLPGVARQIAVWVRKWGVVGTARKIWRGDQSPPVPAGAVPTLRSLLEDPNAPVAAPLFRLLDAARAPVCIVEHDWDGGAQTYCQQRVDSLLAEGRSVLRLRYGIATGRLLLTVLYGSETFHCEVDTLDDLADSRFPAINALVVNELAGWRAWRDTPTGALPLAASAARVPEDLRALARVAKQHDATLEFLFHDYYSLCPTITLLTPELVYCGLSRPLEACDACALRGEPFSMAAWRAAWGEFLSLADELVFFSEDTLKTVGAVYALRPEQIRLRPHSVDVPAPALAIPAEGPMRVAVAGHIQLHKGAAIVCRLAALLKERMPEASVLVFGNLDAPNPPDNVTVLGPYARESLPELLRRHMVTVGLFPSVCPETFSYVVHELALLGLPLVSFGLGAQGAYVRTLPNSRAVDEVSPEAALEALLDLNARRTSSPAH